MYFTLWRQPYIFPSYFYSSNVSEPESLGQCAYFLYSERGHFVGSNLLVSCSSNSTSGSTHIVPLAGCTSQWRSRRHFCGRSILISCSNIFYTHIASGLQCLHSILYSCTRGATQPSKAPEKQISLIIL